MFSHSRANHRFPLLTHEAYNMHPHPWIDIFKAQKYIDLRIPSGVV